MKRTFGTTASAVAAKGDRTPAAVAVNQTF